jgi:SAM-dependent methyltransferase
MSRTWSSRRSTPRVAFALRRWFAEVWAADQEPGMIAVAIRKAAGDSGFIFRTAPVEELDAPPGAFDLVTIGNAFHRLPRDGVAANIRRWLRPGGHLALLWENGPAAGDAPWQQALRDVMHSWQGRNGADRRIPPGYDAARRARPDRDVLAAAGFDVIAEIEVGARHAWTLDGIAG